jgi:hypothetical protein
MHPDPNQLPSYRPDFQPEDAPIGSMQYQPLKSKGRRIKKVSFETLDSPSSLCKRMGDIAGSGDELEVPRRRNQ